MKKIILMIMIMGLTFLNLFLFKNYYKERKNDNSDKNFKKQIQVGVYIESFNLFFCIKK